MIFMYIPLWLIIIGAIAFYIYSKNKEKSEENLDLDLPRKKIKWVDTNSLDSSKTERSLSKHENKISSVKEDSEKIKQEREKFNEELGLGQRIWRFIEDTRHYHAWLGNAKKGDKEARWESSAMSEKDFVLKKFSSSDLKQLVHQSSDFGENDEIIEYFFEVGENKYTLFINKNSRIDHNNNRGYITYHSVIIFENSKRIVYQAKVYQDSNEGGYFYDHDELEAFKPGLWVQFLLAKMLDIRKEYEQFMKELSEGNKKFFDKLNKEKFVD